MILLAPFQTKMLLATTTISCPKFCLRYEISTPRGPIPPSDLKRLRHVRLQLIREVSVVGYPIFDRSTKPLGLTEPGKRYIETVEKILQMKAEYAEYIDDLGELKTGQARGTVVKNRSPRCHGERFFKEPFPRSFF